MYKELGEEARQALREEEEQEAVKSLMNEAAGFLAVDIWQSTDPRDTVWVNAVLVKGSSGF